MVNVKEYMESKYNMKMEDYFLGTKLHKVGYYERLLHYHYYDIKCVNGNEEDATALTEYFFKKENKYIAFRIRPMSIQEAKSRNIPVLEEIHENQEKKVP